MLLLIISLVVALVARQFRFPYTLVLVLVGLLLGGFPLCRRYNSIQILHLVRYFDDHLIEMTITFSTAYGVYLLGEILHISGLLAVVVAGLTLGSYGRHRSMSDRTRMVVDDVWEFIGYTANSFSAPGNAGWQFAYWPLFRAAALSHWWCDRRASKHDLPDAHTA